MGKFDGVLLASDFDNTLLNTETARRTGAEVPEVSRRNWEALEYFMAGGGDLPSPPAGRWRPSSNSRIRCP